MSAIIHKTKTLMMYDPNATYPENWMDDDWFPVPSELEDKLLRFSPTFLPLWNEAHTELLDIQQKPEVFYTSPVKTSPVKIPTDQESLSYFMKKLLSTFSDSLDDEDKLHLYGLYEKWSDKKYTVGDVFNSGGQTWECYAALDPALNPGVTPDTPAWYNFFRPLHGKTPDTARRFVAVHGAHDMYHAGEYMVWTDGKIYRCTQDTNFSPEDYEAAWEVYESADQD